jgi:phosphatidylinositol dimannoside acyltransferase
MPRATLRQRSVAALVAFLSAAALRFPDSLLHRVADVAGAGWYLVTPSRRARARRNLARVCRELDRRGIASPAVSSAAHDDAALERMVLAAYRQAARYYLEMISTSRYTTDYLRAHLRLETPEVLTEMFPDGQLARPCILVGMHFGALELPSLLLSRVYGQTPVAPMERLPNPALQAYLERTRGATGVHIVGIRGSAPVLRAELARGGLVGLIADRDIAGSGVAVDLFGAPARIPAGPALLAVETGAEVYVAAVRRTGWGEYVGRAVRLDVPAKGTRRERLEACLRAEAATFEALIAQAPEQWWSVFFPIWADAPGRLAETAATGERAGADAPPARPAATGASAGNTGAGGRR